MLGRAGHLLDAGGSTQLALVVVAQFGRISLPPRAGAKGCLIGPIANILILTFRHFADIATTEVPTSHRWTVLQLFTRLGTIRRI